MDITLTHYLIVCPLVFLAGYIDAVAGATFTSNGVKEAVKDALKKAEK